MAEQFSRRSFLKGGALTAGAFALGGLLRVDTAMAAPQEKAKVFLRRTSASKG
ncbi:twin-arginine translocation signal domain-containing protein [Bilophila sp. 4_1_30]|uniref:twin-arginine translocation signal domain-containing protein n=1 Tax=Bilophila sp. 4_1_30 TaxID=693988 RepID=UPI0002FC3411|nr:twin-arginine translocation signal domain-containing protein [Bilophila sp. 4_1_30]